ncbi:hypothetical protein CMI41_04515 [Candidatus Pacearchaeota archaeon]|jgi:hypothetical protein|nr:hypothetical protein [Candidatus Pacearchaeota archaeon]|tara:strand:+ start:7505 stop:7837 length:333 start_codon:yes stop_codon:yes gene_type:complete
MENYNVEYYFLDIEGHQLGYVQSRLFEAESNEDARIKATQDFKDLKEIYERQYPGVSSIRVTSIGVMEGGGLGNGMRDWLRREREIDDFKMRSMTPEEMERDLRDFVSDN